ncbi:HlyD family efflux transporter periplasmic adaptor subunit [Nocardioides sp. DS6]|uniref:HlyD family efflux transporter periplasmic adaptor subunit n=1 Tax=Nocardioides eburneus TaxID=3231482 RepID=A0ABV3STX0_9ACTN
MKRPARRWLKAATGTVVAVVVIGGGYATYAATASGASGYRTAAVTKGDVEQTLALSGTIAPTGRVDLAFGTSGTVSKVAAEGDKVTKGQVVARLDRSSLQATVTKAKASLASARAQLETDEEAQTSATTTSSSSTSTSAAGSEGGTTTAVYVTRSTTAGASSVTPVVATAKASTSAGSVVDPAACAKDISDALNALSSVQGEVPATGDGSDLALAITDVSDAKKDVSTAQDAVDTAQGKLNDAVEQLDTLLDTAASDGTSSSDLIAQIKTWQTKVTDAATSLGDATSALDDATKALSDATTGAEALLGNVKGAIVTLGGDLSSTGNLAASLRNAQSDCAGTENSGDDTSGSEDESGKSGQTGQGGQSGNSDQPGKGQQTTPSQSGKGGKTPSLPGKGQQTPGGTQSAPQGSEGTQSGQSGQSSQSSQSGGVSGSGGRSVTAATLAKDQASIDQAKAELVAAQQALKGATLRAPAAGIVAAVDVATGDSASAGSDAVTIVSKGLITVDVNVTSTQVRDLKVGQKASVTPAGADDALEATVTAIGQVPATSSGSTTYPVTVTLAKRGLDLLTGTTASVDVVVGSADGVLTVPTSAVSDGTVTVLDDGEPQRVRVTTGVVGRSRTEVTDGLKAGEQVVLADLSTPLPTGDSSGQQGFGSGQRGGSASFSGGGFGAGGFSGGAPTFSR